MRASKRLAGIALVAAAALSGCSLAPKLALPAIPVAVQYKEQPPWMPAQPADGLARGDWWTMYGDSDLNVLETRLVEHSPDLAAALARYNQAKAYSDQLRSGLFPSLALGASSLREGLSTTTPLRLPSSTLNADSFTVGVQADYELDLWGSIRNEVAAGRAQAQASAADLESARLSLQAQLADEFIVLRGLDRQIALLNQTVTAYEKALALTEARHTGGITAGLDVARAQTQLSTSRSLVAQTQAARALSEHAIAALVGASASEFSLEPSQAAIALPAVPVGVPGTLVQRRPDIAAAERRVIASNANIGVARAAYFPAITLSGAAGYQSTATASFLSASNAYWSIGSSLLTTLFDAGKRKAQVAQAKAALDESASMYRSVVLVAFQQVEDGLALVDHYRTAATEEHSAMTAAERSLQFSMTQYREGEVNYLDVVISQTAALQTQLDSLNLDTTELRASVQLIRALGGGWTSAQLSHS